MTLNFGEIDMKVIEGINLNLMDCALPLMDKAHSVDRNMDFSMAMQIAITIAVEQSDDVWRKIHVALKQT